eukprot:g2869.t1 g2869   contig12:953095-954884(-)
MKQRHTTQHDGDGAAHQTSSIVQGFANGIHGSNGDIKGAILSCSSIEHSIPSLAASSDDEVVSPPRTAAADVHHVIPFEDGDIDNTPKKKQSLCCWQGIGLDGDEISLNVSEDSTLGLSPMPVTPGDSVSPLTERSASTSLFRRGRSIRPASIDYEKHAITDVVYETKSRGSVATLESRNKHLDSKPKQRSICNELMAELDGLSSKLSVVDLDDDSLVSFSKERCVDLARRLEKMEIQLLELVGESSTKKIQSVSTNATQADALKALIRAADFQRKRADALKKKVKFQEKKITTLNALCESLLDNKEQSLIAQSELKEETEEISLTITSLQRRLRKSDSYNDELKLKLEEVVMRASRLETEGNEKSRSMLRLEELLLASYAENEKIQNDLEGCIAQMSDSVLEVFSPSKVVPQDHYNLQDESKRREEEDKATILQLQTAISTMKVSHERAEKLSESKINILIEMKLALEEQVRLLESK